MAAVIKIALQRKAANADAAAKARADAARQKGEVTPVASTKTRSTPTQSPVVSKTEWLPPKVDGGFWLFQRTAAVFYKETKVQWFVAGLIGWNFMMNVLEKWIDPRTEKYPVLWYGFEIFFNLIFLAELLVNMYGFWFWHFWMSAWNLFDFVVVVTSIITMFVDLPPPLNMLRMMRAFRVFRLFKRVKSLNKIIVSLTKAVPGVTNAFLILLIVMCIAAIVAVETLSDFGNDGYLYNEFGRNFTFVTARGKFYGDEYFGNFGKSLYTMFQVLTGESWSEAVSRPILHSDAPDQAIGVSIFFVSFQLLTSIVLLNVVVAVLLEKMVDGEEETLMEAVEDAIELAKDHKASALIAEHEVMSGSGSVTFENGLEDSSRSLSNGDASLSSMEADLQDLKADIVLIKEKMSVLLTAMLPASTYLE